MDLEVEEYKHRFAVWTAHRAAFRGQKGADAGSVSNWFNAAGFSSRMSLPAFNGDLRKDQKVFDAFHQRSRKDMIECSKTACGGYGLTHGRAAKAINVYLKTRFVLCEPGGNAARVIHPPIDRILLENIGRKCEALRSLVRKPNGRDPISWTSLESQEYDELIAGFRTFVGNMPFWKLEYFWDVGASDDE